MRFSVSVGIEFRMRRQPLVVVRTLSVLGSKLFNEFSSLFHTSNIELIVVRIVVVSLAEFLPLGFILASDTFPS